MKTLNGYEIVDAKARQDIANIKHPTKVSELENDKGYLTEHQSLDGKADKVHTHKLNEITDYTAPDLSGYAKKSDIPDVSKFITEVPSEYVTDTELNAKGYLTEHQDLSTYATKTFVNNAIANVEPDLTSYATKTYVANTVQAAIDDIPAPDIPSLDGYATEQYVDDAIAAIDIPDVSPYVYTIKIENDACVSSSTELKTLYNKVMSGERVLCYWSCPEGVCHTRVRINSSSSAVMINPSSAYVQGEEVKFISGQLNISSNGATVYGKEINSETAPTKSYVDDAIAALEARIAALEDK